MFKKILKSILKFLFRRRVLVIISLIAQILLFFFLVAGTSIYLKFSYWVLFLLSVIVCINIINKQEKAGFKLTWIFIILLFPLFGGILYVLLNIWSNPKKFRKALFGNIAKSREAFYLTGNRLNELIDTHPDFKTQAHYLQEYAGFPVYGNTRQEYFPTGESFFKRVIEDLEKAQNYIFMEFFILKEGLMFNSMMKILEQKAAAGLDVG